MDDLHIWRAAGLTIDGKGFVLPSNGVAEGTMKDDMISNALLWILAKVFNYIADTKHLAHRRQSAVTEAQIQSPASNASLPDESPAARKERWTNISHQLDVWHDGLPDWFQPCARIERTATESATKQTSPHPKTIPDIWFASSMCASTIQTYHLARILLLVHKPHFSNEGSSRGSTVYDFVSNHRSVEAELRYRSREIFGIALSSPTTSIMLHQTQTIFVAAQCLVDDDERYMALDILRRVNSDLGWETEYRVQQLLKEWGWDVS